MGRRNSVKRTLLAASAIAAAGMAASAHAAPAYEPAPIEIAAPVAHAADEAKAEPAVIKKIGIAAGLTAGLAALVHLIGLKRVAGWLNKGAPVAAKAAQAMVAVPVAAAKAIGRAAVSPLRVVMLAVGLGVFSLTGLSLFDVEWAGGLAAGAAMVALAWFISGRARRAFAPAKAKPTEQPKA